MFLLIRKAPEEATKITICPRQYLVELRRINMPRGLVSEVSLFWRYDCGNECLDSH
jgi:hypothetical protein